MKDKKALLTSDGKQGLLNNQHTKSTSNNHRILKDGKTKEIVKLFVNGEYLSCLDHWWTGDTCLHSTVSSLSKRHGLEIPREWLYLPNRKGKPVRVKRYFFSNSDVEIMKPLLGEG